MQRPVVKKPSYLNLWYEFFVFQSAARKLANNKFGQTKAAVMNVSTVFPEGFPDERPQRLASLDRKDEEEDKTPNNRLQRAKDFVGLEDVSRLDYLIELFAEAAGTFFLVLLGCSSCIAWSTEPTVLHIAFTFGLAVASLAHTLGPISGCHINPAVSVGLLVSGRSSFLRVIGYLVCQCCGAIAGAATLKVMLPAIQKGRGLGITKLGPGVTESQGIIMEALITFLLVLVVNAVTDPRRNDVKGWAPLAIGLTISVAHMAAVPLTGSSMNPARTLGPAVIEGYFTNLWIYWVGPITGGCVAGGIYKLGFKINKEEDEASYDF